MMVAVAQSDGSITERERMAITADMVKRFGATQPQAEELFARARWAVQDRNDAAEVFRRLTPLVQRTCGPTERSDLIEMLGNIAAAHGTADAILTQDITRLEHSLRLSA
jgi:uncharacterized tellurite resistance protein B-like protein